MTVKEINYCKSIAYKTDEPTLEISVKSTSDNEVQHTIKSSKPLQPKELEELAGVDGVTSYIKQTWLKSHRNGEWTYSILVYNVAKDFYNFSQLQKKLSDILPEVKPVKLPKVVPTVKGLLALYVSDIHAGSLGNELTPFPTKYTKSILNKRLNTHFLKTKEYVKDNVYEECWLVNLGDSINSWQGHTTRQGHEVPSENNRTQFDIFVQSLSQYYENIFNSGIAKKYKVISILNDNHSGVDLSYMATKAVELYLMNKYPTVEFIHQEKFIDIYQYGKHRFAFTHGKDEKLMKYPMKAILDDKLDNWLFQYFNHNKCNPEDTFNHLIKGDIHIKNELHGKFGRYVNVPSVMGTSDYIAINYGYTKPGAIIEEYSKCNNNVITFPIWF